MESVNSNTNNDIDFKEFKVLKAPSEAYYIPNFITTEEEEKLLQSVANAPKPKWTQLSNRRLQNWGGHPHAKGMVPEKIPQWLDSYLSKLGSMNIFDGKIPNHVLVNEYLPGQGIMPHLDGPIFYPTISTITLGSHTVLDFYKQLDDVEDSSAAPFSSRYVSSFLLERRSLVCFKEDMYSVYMHGIDDLKEDILKEKKILNLDVSDENEIRVRETRVSLTIRHFPKVLKCKFKFGRR